MPTRQTPPQTRYWRHASASEGSLWLPQPPLGTWVPERSPVVKLPLPRRRTVEPARKSVAAPLRRGGRSADIMISRSIRAPLILPGRERTIMASFSPILGVTNPRMTRPTVIPSQKPVALIPLGKGSASEKYHISINLTSDVHKPEHFVSK